MITSPGLIAMHMRSAPSSTNRRICLEYLAEIVQTREGLKMDSFLNPFKRGLLEQRRQVGLWMTTGSATMTEIAAGAGLDWLLIDMEHSPNDLISVVDHLRAAASATTEAVVRVPWNEPVLVKRLLD